MSPAFCSKQDHSKLHHFDEITVKTEQHFNGQFTAIDADAHGIGNPVGTGFSRFHAIADLFEKIPRTESEQEDRQADKWDHERDLMRDGIFGW